MRIDQRHVGADRGRDDDARPPCLVERRKEATARLVGVHLRIGAVGDLEGNILGVFRMPDSTTFSIDVAVAKAYGWNDYTTGMRDTEILRRLLKLNLERTT